MSKPIRWKWLTLPGWRGTLSDEDGRHLAHCTDGATEADKATMAVAPLMMEAFLILWQRSLEDRGGTVEEFEPVLMALATAKQIQALREDESNGR